MFAGDDGEARPGVRAVQVARGPAVQGRDDQHPHVQGKHQAILQLHGEDQRTHHKTQVGLRLHGFHFTSASTPTNLDGGGQNGVSASIWRPLIHPNSFALKENSNLI